MNPVEHLKWRFFAIFFFCEIHEKTPVPESLDKVAGLYPTTSLKKRTPTKVFSDYLCEILKTEHLQATASVLPIK